MFEVGFPLNFDFEIVYISLEFLYDNNPDDKICYFQFSFIHALISSLVCYHFEGTEYSANPSEKHVVCMAIIIFKLSLRFGTTFFM